MVTVSGAAPGAPPGGPAGASPAAASSPGIRFQEEAWEFIADLPAPRPCRALQDLTQSSDRRVSGLSGRLPSLLGPPDLDAVLHPAEAHEAEKQRLRQLLEVEGRDHPGEDGDPVLDAAVQAP